MTEILTLLCVEPTRVHRVEVVASVCVESVNVDLSLCLEILPSVIAASSVSATTTAVTTMRR